MFADLSNAVDLLVHLGPVVVTLLAGAGDWERYSWRMPRADARHFTQAFVSLALQLTCVPPGRHS